MAAQIDEQWKHLRSQSDAERLPIGSADEAVRGTLVICVVLTVAMNARNLGPAEVLKNLPGKDPGAKFEPRAWTGTVQGRQTEDKQTSSNVEQKEVKAGVDATKEPSLDEGSNEGEWTGKVGRQ